MHSTPQKEHQWLESLVGEWTYTHEAVMQPGAPPESFTGTETVRTLGGLWIVMEGRGEMPGGGTSQTVTTLGYDPARSTFIGTFVASMMTHLWVYEGELDASGRLLTLNTEGPSFIHEGSMSTYKDVIEIRSRDERILTSHVLGEDGSWNQFMTGIYRRK